MDSGLLQQLDAIIDDMNDEDFRLCFADEPQDIEVKESKNPAVHEQIRSGWLSVADAICHQPYRKVQR